MKRKCNDTPDHARLRDELGIRLDCRHYIGDRPCARGCQGGCQNYEGMGQRILIIKLGALGDVIRTAALLPGIKQAYPRSHVTWVSEPNGCRVLTGHPDIDRLLCFDTPALCQLQVEAFDIVFSLDKEPAPAALAMQVYAPDKRGVGLSANGTVYPLNDEAFEYFRLGLSDELKFHDNNRSYQELVYQAVALPYAGQRYRLCLSDDNRAAARAVLERAGVGPQERIIGLNTGAGSVFANKTWPTEKFEALARRMSERCDCRIALLGGPDEVERNEQLAAALGSAVIHTGCKHSEREFAALVGLCSAVLTGDTTAMHMAIALDVPAVVLFGPTCSQEIDLYGHGAKLRSGIACAPCYRRQCDVAPNCMDLITVEQAEMALVRCLYGDSIPVSLGISTSARPAVLNEAK